MTEKLKKKSSKELFLLGITSASIFISGSAFALEKTNNSNFNQLSDNSASLADSTVSSRDVLAQTTPEDNTPPPPGDVRPRENPPPAPRGSSGDSGPRSSDSDGGSSVGSPQPPDAKPRGSTPPPTGTSPTENRSSGAATGPKPGTWYCINNPNPSCKG